MLRFVIRRKYQHESGANGQLLQTIDAQVPELEALLTNGSLAAETYDITELVGVEILPSDRTPTAEQSPSDGMYEEIG